jgi:hypothetical protein
LKGLYEAQKIRRSEANVVDVGMQTLEDDEDRSRLVVLLPHRSANITVIVVIVTSLGL